MCTTHIVFENLRFVRPQVNENPAFSEILTLVSVFSEYVWTVARPNRAKKKSVFKRKGIRVDRAWVATDPNKLKYFILCAWNNAT